MNRMPGYRPGRVHVGLLATARGRHAACPTTPSPRTSDRIPRDQWLAIRRAFVPAPQFRAGGVGPPFTKIEIGLLLQRQSAQSPQRVRSELRKMLDTARLLRIGGPAERAGERERAHDWPEAW